MHDILQGRVDTVNLRSDIDAGGHACGHVGGHVCSGVRAGMGLAMCAFNLHPGSSTAGAVLVQMCPILQAATWPSCMLAHSCA